MEQLISEASGVGPDDIPPDLRIMPDPIETKAKAIEIRNAGIVIEARSLEVVDQVSLDNAGEMLANRVKALRAEAAATFDPLIASSHKTHKDALAAKARVEKPLIEAEAILKGSIRAYLDEQDRKARAEEQRLRLAHEAEQRRLAAIAEAERKRLEDELNERNRIAHDEEVEQLLDSLPADTPREDVEILCNVPEPAPVRLEPAPVDYAPAPTVQRPVMPQGMSATQRYKVEVASIMAFCKGVLEGTTPVTLVQVDIAAANRLANALKPQGFSVPGLRIVRDTTIRQTVRK